MKYRIPESLLTDMAAALSSEDRDEMAIPSYLHPNPALRWMAWRRVEVVAREMGKLAARHYSPDRLNILDYGCGTGVLFNDAHDIACRIYGVDLVLDCARMLVERCNLSKVDLYTPDEAGTKLADGSVDLIVAAEVLEHVEPPEPVLEWFRRVLSPRGRLLVSLPTEGLVYRLGRRMAGFEGHYHHSNAASIHAAILRCGYRLEKKQAIPLPGPLAIYWVCTYLPANSE